MGTTEPRQIKLGEVAHFRNGKALSAARFSADGRRPVFGSNGQLGRTDELLNPGPVVVIGRVGAFCGSVHRVDEPSWVTDNAIVAEPGQATDFNFLYYSLKALDLNRTAIGSAQPLVTQAGLKNVTLPWPSLMRQRGISRILRSLDDKIDLNSRMNETLEATARAIFKSWFVDFDPVRAKMNGRLSSRMNAGIASPLPDSLHDSPFGGIPGGWTVGSIRDLVSLSRESLDPADSPAEVFDHYSIPAFDEGRVPAKELGSLIRSNKFVVSPGVVLLSKLNPRFPRVWLPFPTLDHRSIASTEFLVATPRPGFSREYVYSLFCSAEFMEPFSGLVTGTSGSHQRVKPDDFLAMPVVLPEPSVAEAYAAKAKPLLNKAAMNIRESEVLAAIRDGLLPRLMSGQLRVAD